VGEDREEASFSYTGDREKAPMETLTDTLIERVDKLVQASKARPEWGSPLLSTTPTSVAVQELAAQVGALEKAVREIALEVQKLSDDQG
jgi:hypothetical protein